MNSRGLIVWWLGGAFRLREILSAMLRCGRVDDFRAINAITQINRSRSRIRSDLFAIIIERLALLRKKWGRTSLASPTVFETLSSRERFNARICPSDTRPTTAG